MKPRILLADDHALVAQALGAYLKDYCELTGVATDGAELLSLVSLHNPDVIVLDLSMPLVSGLDCIRRMRARGYKGKVVVLTMHREADLASECFQAGASGYVLKHSAAEELVTAIEQVLAGHTYMSKNVAEEVLAELSKPHRVGFESLSGRQKDVLRLVVAGRTMKEIAAALRLSPRTVETHKYEMMELLGIRTTAELVQYALRHEPV